MRIRTMVAATALSLLSATAVATPAYAANATLKINLSFTAVSPDAKAHWTDRTDRLCVKARTRGSVAVAKFKRPNGNWVSVRDRPGGGNSCTGNLSIREDYGTTLHLYLHTPGSHTYHKQKHIYT